MSTMSIPDLEMGLTGEVHQAALILLREGDSHAVLYLSV